MIGYNEALKNNPLKTREDMQNAITQICAPLKGFYSDGCSRLHIGNTGTYCIESTARMEAFSRPLWGLVPLLAGGGNSELTEIYLEGIRNGTNPKNEEYWGNIGDKDQLMVEMAVIGLALAIIPDKIWSPLNETEKSNLEDWLNQINDFVVVDSNWLFFRVLVNVGLYKVGAAYSSDWLRKDLDRIDEFYLSEGWYQDGICDQRDYYIPFAMHFYGLIYSKLMKIEDSERSQRYKQRAIMFAKDFIYWFSIEGSSIPFGRSLTYRFAQSAFWSALAFADVEVMSWGVIKGIVMRNLRWWFKNPIFATDGIITIGYAYPNLNMAEGYNAPGSPYWALKTFLPLALGEDHPFWQAEEEPMPTLKSKSVQQHPRMIICRDDEGRHIQAYTSGQHAAFEPVHCAAKYEKFVYSNLYGFSVPRGEYGLEQGAYDSMLALSEGDNLYRVRRKCEEYGVNSDFIYSKWKPWNDVVVKTWLIPLNGWHVRIHNIETGRHLDTAEGGFAIAREKDFYIAESDKIKSTCTAVVAYFPWGTSGITDLSGGRRPEMVWAEPNTNLLAQRTWIPTLKGSLEPGTHILTCAVLGTSGCGTGSEEWSRPPKVVIDGQKAIISDSKLVHYIELI